MQISMIACRSPLAPEEQSMHIRCAPPKHGRGASNLHKRATKASASRTRIRTGGNGPTQDGTTADLRPPAKEPAEASVLLQVRVLLLKRLVDARGHELLDIPAHLRDLAHDGAGQVHVLRRGHDEQRFQLRGELVVHGRHLELVLEVGDGSQAFDHHGGVKLLGEIDEQALELQINS